MRKKETLSLKNPEGTREVPVQEPFPDILLSRESISSDIQTSAQDSFEYEKFNSESTLQSMEVDMEDSEESENNHTPVTWTSNIMKSLRSVVEIHASISEEDETEVNFDFNAVQENDKNALRDSDEETEADEIQFPKLQDFLDRKNIFDRIDVRVKVSVAELLLMLIKFALVSTLSLSTVASLFTLLNCIFAKPIIPETRHLIDKLFNLANSTTLDGLCTQCGIDIGTFIYLDSQMHCTL